MLARMTAYAEMLDNPWLLTAAAGLALVVALVVVRLVVWAFRRISKLAVGTVVVQAGVTFAVLTGTYEFCYKFFEMDWREAAAIALFVEAATWVTIGMVHEHIADPKTTGFGPAIGFFWLFCTLGGILAVIGGDSLGEKVGRAVVVVIGACLWYLTLLLLLRRAGKTAERSGPTTLLWSPRRLAIWLRIIAPGEHDEIGIDRTRRVRALTRVGHRAADGPKPLRAYYRLRLAAIARSSDENMLAAAAAQVALGRRALTYMAGAGNGRHGERDARAHDDAQRALTPPLACDFDALTDPAHYARNGDGPVSPAPYGVSGQCAPDMSGECAADERGADVEVSGGAGEQRAAGGRGMPPEARAWIARSLRAGKECTGVIVGKRYGVAEQTGRRWIDKVRKETTTKGAAR